MPKVKRNKRKDAGPAYPIPEWCSGCGKVTTAQGGVCTPCVLRDRAEEAARNNPPPEPEPVVEQPRSIGSPRGCFSCGVEGHGKLCAGCASTRFGLPRRESDPVLRYPAPCCRETGW